MRVKGARPGTSMLGVSNSILWPIGVLALGVVMFLVRGHFDAEARARRRREKSNRPVVSRKQGPTVRLAVDVDQPKRDRKR
jgi:hypothetical protein